MTPPYGKDIAKMKPILATKSPATSDTGRIRLGGGWRLPAAKPTR
jgi:hypothetical protein